MKNLLLIVLLTTTFMIAKAQERQDAASLTFTAKSPQLTTATGWYQSLDGKWIDNKNKLSTSQIDFINGMEPNFTWIQMATMTVSGKKYYILYTQYVDGEYDYPLTKVDWKYYNNVQGLMLDQQEYDMLKSALTKKEGKDITIIPKKTILPFRLYEGYKESELLTEIKKNLDLNIENGYDRLVINVQTIKGVDIVRFVTPCKLYVQDLSKFYYEVPLADFKKLLID